MMLYGSALLLVLCPRVAMRWVPNYRTIYHNSRGTHWQVLVGSGEWVLLLVRPESPSRKGKMGEKLLSCQK